MTTRRDLCAAGISHHTTDAQLAGERWQQFGKAIILQNGPMSEWQRRLAIAVNCGPRAVLTSFTSAESHGLKRWERPDVHVLAPAGTTRPKIRGLVLHRVGDWSDVHVLRHRRLHALAPSLVIAASSFRYPDPACGLLAAAVQQRLVRPRELHAAVAAASRTRHRRALLVSLGDIEQGAESLSEIRFSRICQEHNLPSPNRQFIREEPGGRRRYLDAEWDLPGGRRLVVEVDGAHHMNVEQVDDDNSRQNFVVLGGDTVVLRYSSNFVRHRPREVAAQLRLAFEHLRS